MNGTPSFARNLQACLRDIDVQRDMIYGNEIFPIVPEECSDGQFSGVECNCYDMGSRLLFIISGTDTDVFSCDKKAYFEWKRKNNFVLGVAISLT